MKKIMNTYPCVDLKTFTREVMRVNKAVKGSLVMDEEHEPTYKSENSPRYHARETAVHRAQMEGARVVLGSATPSLEAYNRALTGEYLLVKLDARFQKRPLPCVSVVHMR